MNISPTYDLFISYDQADQAWVEGYLLDALAAAGLRLHSEETFRLGMPRLLEFERAILQSKRTLLVLTPAYLAAQAGSFVEVLAQSYGAETGTWPVIPLLLQAVKLPPRLAQLVALDATDPEEWDVAIARLLADLEREPPPAPALPACPYPGMRPYREVDSERFYGRDAEIEEMQAQLRVHPFLTVIGPSGSGKSSLVFAGLLPALRQSHLFGDVPWELRSLRPGQAPLAALQSALAGRFELETGQPLAQEAESTANLLLVVDQFEETFTLEGEGGAAFQEALLRLIKAPGLYLVLTVRADFYAELMASPLWPSIQAHRFEVLPLDEAGLRQVIEQPAADVGVYVEAALVERLAADAAGEPGVLPLLQETLVLLWDKVDRRFLPLRAYEALVLPRAAYGAPPRTGLQVAIARRADAALAALPPEGQVIARRIFLRLIQFGEGRADTRRQQPVAALRASGEDAAAFEATLTHLAGARLLTLSGGEGEAVRRADIAHEALIAGWDQLHRWIEVRREAEQTRRRLQRKAEEWLRLGEAGGGLLDEVELREAERWLAGADAAELGASQALIDLVAGSRAAIEQAAAAQEAARQRELQLQRDKAEAERQRAEEQTRATGRFRRLAAILAAVFLLAAVAAVFATTQWRTSERLRRISLVQALAASAQNQLDAKDDEQGALLARQTYLSGQPVLRQTEDMVDATLRAALDTPYFSTVLPGPNSLGRSVALAADGGLVAAGWADGRLRLWDRRAPGLDPVTWQAHGNETQAVLFTPDARTLISGGCDERGPRGDKQQACLRGEIRFWDVDAALAGGDALAPVRVFSPHTDQVSWLALDAAGTYLFSGSWDGNVYIWSLADLGAEPRVVQDRAPYEISTLAISPDGRTLVTGSQDGRLRLFDLAMPEAQPWRLDADMGVVNALAFSPDGAWLAASGLQAIKVWDTETWAEPVLLGGLESRVRSLAFSPNGALLATATFNEIDLWQVGSFRATPLRAALLHGHDNVEIFEVTFSQDGAWMASVGGDETVRLWDMRGEGGSGVAARPYFRDVVSFAFNNEGLLAAGSFDRNVQATWWQLEQFPTPARQFALGHRVQGVAWSPDGRWFAVSQNQGKIRLWDTTRPEADPIVIVRGTKRVNDLAFSPDGQWLATAHEENNLVRLWSLAALQGQPSETPVIHLLGHEKEALSVAFSPDGRWLASGGRDTNVYLWSMERLAAAPSYVLRGHTGRVGEAVFSPDGRWLASAGSDDSIRLWRADDFEAAPIVLPHKGWVATVAWRPDSAQLASAGGDNNIRLWDLRAIDAIPEPVVLRGHGRFIWAVAYSPDGRTLVSGDDGGYIRLWALDLEMLAGRVCERASRNLSAREWQQLVGRAVGDEDLPYEPICPDLPVPAGEANAP